MIDKKAREDYHKFEKGIKYKNRFFFDSKFIDSLKKAVKLDTSELGEGVMLYRARIHKQEDPQNSPFIKSEMFNPDPLKAIGKRANPDGISYLYLASDPGICVREVSPQVGDIITIAKFRTIKKIKLVKLKDPFRNSEDEYIVGLNNLIRINFSNRQISARPEIEYLPYQFISELIKNEGYKAVLYYSSHKKLINTDSYNIVLFYPSQVKLVERSLCKITSLNYEYKEILTK